MSHKQNESKFIINIMHTLELFEYILSLGPIYITKCSKKYVIIETDAQSDRQLLQYKFVFPSLSCRRELTPLCSSIFLQIYHCIVNIVILPKLFPMIFSYSFRLLGFLKCFVQVRSDILELLFCLHPTVFPD